MKDIEHAGFADPTHDSQTCFRAILQAISRPGSVQTIESHVAPPRPLAVATAATVLTLVDASTPIWLDDEFSDAAPWISFHCNAPLVESGMAQFAIGVKIPAWDRLNAGSAEFPEQSATLILQVRSLGEGRRMILRGPGISDSVELHVEGLPNDFVESWDENRKRYPRGVDVILCAGDRLVALPRTTSATGG
ncbi:MAG: phosphonate C-P lyase system protein PhnH [Alphaproteobacteria bacterium]|nr:phosphonate C-P lyase system protein PhnH [Alphaproteobacteria bacterium]